MNSAVGPLSIVEIESQTKLALQRARDSRVIAIQAHARSGWPESIVVEGRQFQLRWCDSPLMVREALVSLEEMSGVPENPGVILLLPMSARDLGDDVVARLAKARIFQPDAWAMVLELFKARETDARLNKLKWMAQLLVDRTGMGAYSAVPNGFLDIETAWCEVLKRALKLAAAKPDGALLLAWSLAADSAALFSDLPDSAKPDVSKWLSEAGGAVGALIIRCLKAGNLVDAIPLGLVCGVVLSRQAEGVHELGAAAIRLERFVGDSRIGVEEGRAWALESAKAIRQLPLATRQWISDRAELFLRELHVEGFAHLSDSLTLGFEQRLELLADALHVFNHNISKSTLDPVEKAAELALAHSSADPSGTRMLRVLMALRLCRWLLLAETDVTVSGDREAAPFTDLVHTYTTDGAFVDWARFKLIGGDGLPRLSDAFVELQQLARAKADQFNRSFARALQVWNREPRADASCMPVEAMIDRVVGPLATQAPVLLLVADGMSYGIFRELCDDLEKLGLDEQVSTPPPTLSAGIAALPTITEVSRTSLLSGRLTIGAASQEKKAFSTHPSLVSVSKHTKPVVFHKGDLSLADALAPAVREAIASTLQSVVAVVYNAVDEHLSGSSQIHVPWAVEDLRLLGPLLTEARRAGRVVIITADHGHVIDDGTVLRGAGEGDRWRLPTGEIDPSEILFEGGRVMTDNGSKVVCTWSEGFRHGAKKNGYHGGVSAQEVVVPLSIFVPRGITLKGWTALVTAKPVWWTRLDEPLVKPAVEAAPASRRPLKAKPGSVVPQPDLFGVAPAIPELAPAAITDWITALQTSPAYEAQKKLTARVAPADADVRALLEVLHSRGGTATKIALGQRLNMPPMRISGFVSAAKRLLNLDQQPVLILDETAGTVELNRDLLLRQFRVLAQ